MQIICLQPYLLKSYYCFKQQRAENSLRKKNEKAPFMLKGAVTRF